MRIRRGSVTLVGAGPGDPGLITVAGREALSEAEVVVHDFLVDPRVLALAPGSARRLYAGKRAGQHQIPQSRIHRLLIRHARLGRRVVRLKGGDSFVFGRGGEEAEACRRAGIPFRVVPGVTSGSAVPACAGIPVTHRGLASAVAFVTGHEDRGKAGGAVDWEALARFPGTLVFFMAMRALPSISRNLVAGGMAPSTPAAAIRWGSLPEQETVTGTLAGLPARAAALGTPALIVVGNVVRLRRSLAWFERRPLFGRRIAVTRAREQASVLESRLAALGASVFMAPAIRIAPPADRRPLDRAALALARGRYPWLVVSSPNVVRYLFDALARAGADARALAGVRVVAIGPATAGALEARGIRPDLMPARNTSAGIVSLLRSRRRELAGRRLLLPRSDLAPPGLPAALRGLGARVATVEAYRTAAEPIPPETAEALREGRLDAVLFSSASTVRNFAAACRRARLAPGRARRVSIGPETSRAIRAEGWRVSAEASPHTLEGLVRALKRVLTGAPRPR